ncbi:MAG: helix-turn-helix transcriptional regulator [Eggerthellaceae bacterium]|nr:helix-turn-helix transcriptional regulator [Eggerthellaceae bacterium]
MNAYSEHYLDGAMDNLGEAFDYAADCCDIDLDLFLSMFIVSGFAARFEAGEPKVVAGISGTELAIEVLYESGMHLDFPPAKTEYSFSPEYWCGWILAYCQWKTARPFANIRRYMNMHDLLALYGPLHEAGEDRFMDAFYDRVRTADFPTRLQEQRKISGLTQRELADAAGVNLRTLQQYENRSKDINKAAGASLHNLARVLGVRMEDLLEY